MRSIETIRQIEDKNLDISTGALLVIFLVTHFWWIGFILTIIFCNGATATGGYNCSIPIDGLAGFIEFSTYLIFPPFLAIIFYIILRKTNYNSRSVGPVTTVLLLGLLIAILHFMS